MLFPRDLPFLTIEVNVPLGSEQSATVLKRPDEPLGLRILPFPAVLNSPDDPVLAVTATFHEVVLSRSDAEALETALNEDTWTPVSSPLTQWILAARTRAEHESLSRIKWLLVNLLNYGQIERVLVVARKVVQVIQNLVVDGQGRGGNNANQHQNSSTSDPTRHFWMFVSDSMEPEVLQLLDTWEQRIHALDWRTPMEKHEQDRGERRKAQEKRRLEQERSRQEEERREQDRKKELEQKGKEAEQAAATLMAAKEDTDLPAKESSKSRKKKGKKGKRAAGKKKKADESTNTATPPALSAIQEAEEAPPICLPSPHGESWTLVEKSRRRPQLATRLPPLFEGLSLTTPLPAPPGLSSPVEASKQRSPVALVANPSPTGVPSPAKDVAPREDLILVEAAVSKSPPVLISPSPPPEDSTGMLRLWFGSLECPCAKRQLQLASASGAELPRQTDFEFMYRRSAHERARTVSISALHGSQSRNTAPTPTIPAASTTSRVTRDGSRTDHDLVSVMSQPPAAESQASVQDDHQATPANQSSPYAPTPAHLPAQHQVMYAPVQTNPAPPYGPSNSIAVAELPITPQYWDGPIYHVAIPVVDYYGRFTGLHNAVARQGVEQLHRFIELMPFQLAPAQEYHTRILEYHGTVGEYRARRGW